MLNRKQLLSMAFLALGLTMTQTTAFAGQRTEDASTDLMTKPRVTKYCYYSGKRYAEGSVIKHKNGSMMYCYKSKWMRRR